MITVRKMVGPCPFSYIISPSLTPQECYKRDLPYRGSSFLGNRAESLHEFGFGDAVEMGSRYIPGRSHRENVPQTHFWKSRAIGKSKRLRLQLTISKRMFSIIHSLHMCRWAIWFVTSLVIDSGWDFPSSKEHFL